MVEMGEINKILFAETQPLFIFGAVLFHPGSFSLLLGVCRDLLHSGVLDVYLIVCSLSALSSPGHFHLK